MIIKRNKIMEHKNELIDLKKRRKKLKFIYSDLIAEINNKTKFYHNLSNILKKERRTAKIALKKSVFRKGQMMNQALFFQTLEDQDRKVTRRTNRKLAAILTMSQYEYQRKYEECLIKINENLDPNYKDDNRPLSEEYYEFIVTYLPCFFKKNKIIKIK